MILKSTTICLFASMLALPGLGQSFTKEYRNSKRDIISIYERNPEANLMRYPLIKYHVVDEGMKGLRIGDSIPEEIWNLPMWTVNHPEGRDTIRLSSYRNKSLLVLDFWASWCAPCVESMDKWERYSDSLPGDIALIGVHLDFDYKALPFVQKRGWKSPNVIGGEAWLLNRYFFKNPNGVISRMVWIKDGKLIAITSTRGYDLDLVKQVVGGRDVKIPIDSNWTYFAKDTGD